MVTDPKYKSGQVWMKDCLGRMIVGFEIAGNRVDEIHPGQFGVVIWRRYGGRKTEKRCHIGTWMDWVDGAELVERSS